MDEFRPKYKPNSHKFKEDAKSSLNEEKKIQKVVAGNVKTRKKSDIQKFTDVFISEDIGNVKNYILMDVLIPRIRDTVVDIIKNSVDMIFYGGASGPSSKRSTVSKVSYSRYYNESGRRDYNSATKTRSGLDYDDIIFDNRGDAEAVLSAMEDIIDQYGVVSVGDLYDLAEISTKNYAVNKYGWTDIRSATVFRSREGYMLKLPRALPLD